MREAQAALPQAKKPVSGSRRACKKAEKNALLSLTLISAGGQAGGFAAGNEAYQSEMAMPLISSQQKRVFFTKRKGVILWVLIWPFVSLLFDSNPHYPAFFTPIGLLINLHVLFGAVDWKTILFERVDESSFLFFREFVLPGIVFWIVFIGVLVFFPGKQR